MQRRDSICAMQSSKTPKKTLGYQIYNFEAITITGKCRRNPRNERTETENLNFPVNSPNISGLSLELHIHSADLKQRLQAKLKQTKNTN